MIKFGSILLFSILTFSIFAQKPELDFFDKIALQERSHFIKTLSFVESQSYGQTDVIYQRMEWEIDPNVLYIKGAVTTYFKSKIQNLAEIEFDLHSSMLVDSVVQSNQKISFLQKDNKIVIQLATTLQKEQVDSVTVFYEGEPSNTGFGAFSKTMHGNIPNIWTLSEPYGAMKWWPCKQSLTDKIDSIDIIVTSPNSFRTASIGILVSETISNEMRKMHWKHRFPIATYLVAISVTNYSSYSDYLELEDGRQIEILNYVYPEDLLSAKEQTPITTEIMKLFNELIGEYPFANEKYGHAQFGWGGGMEHQTMSFMANFSFGLVSHELAHQWFGDYITLGSWQDIWLNEGFATYLTGLSYEHLLEGVWWPRWKKLNVEQIISQPGGSVFVEDTTNIHRIFDSRLSYSKGAHLLHMLRWIVGDENFYLGMQNYFNDPEIANSFARNHQFVKHMENVADTSLTEFFDDWYYGEGFPIYTAQFSSNEANLLKITLSQTTSHNSVDFFEMPVPIRVYSFGKTDSMDFRLNHYTNNQEFFVNTKFDVAKIKIDPEYWLVSKTDEIVNASIISLTEDIIIYPNPFINRINISIPDNERIIETRLLTLEGRLLQKIEGHKTEFYWDNLPTGLYIMQFTTSDKTYEKRILKR